MTTPNTPTPVDYKVELQRTSPDLIVYAPQDGEDGRHDTGNEHFLVSDAPDGSLMAVWTQSSREGSADQHIAWSTSADEGKTWTPVRVLAGPPLGGHIASWAFPLVSRRGRIYILYSQNLGKELSPKAIDGLMHGIYSDDMGATWSAPQNIAMPRSVYDNPDPNKCASWVVWQRPDRLTRDGKYLVGLTRWVDPAIRHAKPIRSWIADESVVEFLRFENVDDNPEPGDLKIVWFAQNEEALRVGFPGTPTLSVAQEPSIVRLPDGRLFCTIRTSTGNPWWTQSKDDGRSWKTPEVLRLHSGGPVLKHPLSPCPIYDIGGVAVGSGDYVFFIHNHDGHFRNWGPSDTARNRRPIYMLRGQFAPNASQPVAFSDPELMMDGGDNGVGPAKNPRYDMALYASLTVRNGQAVFWYPDRKCFLLGKKISPR